MYKLQRKPLNPITFIQYEMIKNSLSRPIDTYPPEIQSVCRHIFPPPLKVLFYFYPIYRFWKSRDPLFRVVFWFWLVGLIFFIHMKAQITFSFVNWGSHTILSVGMLSKNPYHWPSGPVLGKQSKQLISNHQGNLYSTGSSAFPSPLNRERQKPSEGNLLPLTWAITWQHHLLPGTVGRSPVSQQMLNIPLCDSWG